MILNQSQATAIYDAMCALNNVSGVIGNITFPCGTMVVSGSDGAIHVTDGIVHEYYTDQADFRYQYDLF